MQLRRRRRAWLRHRASPNGEVSKLAGMASAPSRGEPRRLADFDAASLTAQVGRQPPPDLSR